MRWLLIWFGAFACCYLFLAVRRMSQPRAPRPPRQKTPPPQRYIPPPTRAELIEDAKRNFFQRIDEIDELGLRELEADKVRTEVRRRYLNRLEELL